MDKTRQQTLLRWLRTQRSEGKGWLRLTQLMGIGSALLIVCQAWLLACLLQKMITAEVSRQTLLPELMLLLLCFFLRALLSWGRERAGFEYGRAIRQSLRHTILNRLHELGPAWIQGKPAGSWATMLLEQIDDMQDYYARYQPQMLLATLIPVAVLLVLFPVNWAAALILFCTAPLIPLFMAMVGLGAAEANRRNFTALARLSSQFLDTLRGLETLRLFYRRQAETTRISQASADFRVRTMDVLKLAFLSSAVLEFFASLSIAVVAVYFGFSYLGELNFGHYGTGVTLFAGFLALILAPEFFQPLRDLGTFYHAKAQAIGGADTLETFLHESERQPQTQGTQIPETNETLTLEANDLIITTVRGVRLAGPLTFTLRPGERVAIVGQSGAGKTSLLQVLLGYLPYQGSLRVNGIELQELQKSYWQQQLTWVGQNPQLPATSLKQNIVMGELEDAERLSQVMELTGIDDFVSRLPHGIDSDIGEDAHSLSVGQAQRIAVARALYKPGKLLLLDEPTASLDSRTEAHLTKTLLAASRQQTTLLVTHQLTQLDNWDVIWLMHKGKIVQQGQYQQLIQQLGPFAELVAARQEIA
ncbi:MAG: ATP-binding/permease protein CydD [Candidatus Erwinia impunctatus]|nr:ATP-binding/permease protein CydD [Culicoides impunctatus]